VIYNTSVRQSKPMCRNARTSALRARFGTLGLSLFFLASQNAIAFNYPLQEEHVREAYFFGRTTDGKKLIDFYKQYVHDFVFPARGPYYSYVESVEFRTPYQQIVLRSHQNLNQYSSFEAEKDYQAHPNLVIARVLISYKLNYVGPIPSPSSFKVRVSQEDMIKPNKLSTESICSVWDDCGVTRFAILLWFDAEQFASGTARVKITTPDGQILSTEFDLDKLM
jgi:hypothetical protein